MIKACFFDVDGTLYSHTTDCVPESAKNSLSLLRKNGIKTVVCTGRSLSDFMSTPASKLTFDGYITLNGMLCYDADFNVIAKTPIPDEDAVILKMIFLGERIPVTIINEEGLSINIVNNTVTKTQSDANEAVPPIRKYKIDKIYQASAYVNDRQKKLLEKLLDYCDITSWHETGIDIVAKGSGKDVGIKHFIETYGINRDDIMAFGDAENDIRMLNYASIGVALGNASDEVKKIADYVTADIDDDGIEKALKHFNLI